MPVAVQPNFVPCGDDLTRQRGIALDLLANEEEGRLHASVREQLEHRRGALRMRPVVECERIATAARGTVLDAQRPPQRRQGGCQPGKRVADDRHSGHRSGDRG